MHRLRTFGGFGIEREGAAPDPVRVYRKAHALLAVLAVQGSVGRERLTALLWPESDGERAKGSLKQAVHLLRRQLGAPDLLLGTAELRLNPERIESDVGLFTRALAAGDVAAAVGHYGGPFLDGVHLEGAAEFERWVEARRAELARECRDALERLAHAAGAEGEHAAAVRWWRRLQTADPLSSRAAVGLMRALEAAGDRSAALEHARVHEALLSEEWGIAPDPAVAALAERLLSPGPPRQDGGLRPRGAGGAVEAPVPAALEGEEAGRGPYAGLRRPATLALVALVAVAGAAYALAGIRGEGVPGPAEDHGTPPTLPAAAAGSIAVLPFLDLSPAGDQEYFGHGMAEELIAALSRVEGLRVTARTSSFRFQGSGADVREVGRRLGVAHLLEGSVRRAGDRLRITAKLVDTETGYQLWSESYERRMSDVFAIQEEISRAIVRALELRLAGGGDDALVAPPTGDLAAYDPYLRGLYFLDRLQVPQAVEHLGEATRRDPRFARAYAALAEAYAVPAAYSELSPPDARERGVAAARAAIRLDPALADAHAALGWLEMIGFRWEEAERALRHAVALDPRAPRARFYYGLLLHRQERWDEAIAQLRRARELDPLSLTANAVFASFLGDLGRTEEAVAHLQGTLELEPSFPIAHAVLGHLYLGTGRGDEAIHHYERVAASVPSSFYAGFLGHAYGRTGRTDDARRVLAELEARAGRGEHVSPGAVGWVLLGLGERDEGFRWLERAARQRDVFLTIYAVLTNRYLSEPYRDDPHFQRLRRSAGLPTR
jgi:TolB-like protein/DNA-binding SARP family transcriptional activator